MIAEELPRVGLSTLVLAIIASGALTTLLSYLFSKKKTSAETDGIIADTYSQVLGDMRAELNRYQQELKAAYTRITGLEKQSRLQQHRITVLETALSEHDLLIPQGNPTPPDGTSMWGTIFEVD